MCHAEHLGIENEFRHKEGGFGEDEVALAMAGVMPLLQEAPHGMNANRYT